MRKILNRLKRGQGADSKELVSHNSGPTFRVSPVDTLDRATSMCPESSEPRPEGPGLGEESAAVKMPLPGDCFERRNGRTGSQSVAWSSEFHKTQGRYGWS